MTRGKPPAPKPHLYLGGGPNSGCRYPYGDPGSSGFHWCGAKRTHASYCDEHHRLCHQPRPDRLANKLKLVPAIWVGEADDQA